VYKKAVWWVIDSTVLAAWVEDNCGAGSANKHCSSEIKGWDSVYLRALLTGYFRGDGEKHAVSENPASNKTYYNRDKLTNYSNRASTVSRQLVDDIAEIAVKVGLGFRLVATTEFPDKPNWQTQYRFRVDGWNRVIVEYPKQHSWEWYDDYVHCVTVPNGLLVVRRNGKTAVSGNSGMIQSKLLSKTVDSVGHRYP
jgi:hypothetical protein